jgi:hypothetical protein
MAFDDEWLEVGAGGVESGRVTGASGAHDYDVAYVHNAFTRFGERDFVAGPEEASD